MLTLQNAAAAIDAKANVCSVQFSPTDANLMAFGGANYRTYLYDLRHIQVRCCIVCSLTPACTGSCCCWLHSRLPWRSWPMAPSAPCALHQLTEPCSGHCELPWLRAAAH